MKTPTFLKPAYLPIGLDLSASGAKLLQFKRTRRGLEVVGAARIEADVDPSAESAEDRLSPVLEAITSRWRGAGMHGRRCVVGIGRDLVRIRSIRQPKMPFEEAENAVRIEAPDRLGFDPETEESEIGWIRAGEVRQSDQIRDEVIVFGAPTDTLRWLIDGLSDAGLRPIGTEPSFVGAARCFERAGRRTDDDAITRVLVDIGLSSTHLIVMHGASIRFYKAIAVGGRAMNQVVGERLGLDAQGAIDLRTRRIRPTRRHLDAMRDERTERAIFEAVRPVVDELAREISMCLRYYAVSFTGARPAYALVMGGEAAEPGLVEHIEHSVGLPCRLARPLEGVRLGGALAGAEDAPHPEWAAAAGLSLRGSGLSIDRQFIAPDEPIRPDRQVDGGRQAA